MSIKGEKATFDFTGDLLTCIPPSMVNVFMITEPGFGAIVGVVAEVLVAVSRGALGAAATGCLTGISRGLTRLGVA